MQDPVTSRPPVHALARGRVVALAAMALVLALPAASSRAGEKEDVLWAHLRARVQDAEKRLDGVLGLSVKDLKTGTSFEVRADEVFPQASSIKLAVLYELYRQADEGKIDLGQVTRPPLPRVKGGGVLQELGDKVSLTWRDLAVMMVGWSDNEATNVLISRLGMPAVNHRLEDDLDLDHTRLRRKMMDLEAARRGDENVGTPSEMRRLVEASYTGKGLSPAAARDIRAVLATPKDSPFRVPLPETLVVMDKPGSLEAVRCVTAVVDVPGRPYAVSIETTFLKKDEDGAAAIREISAALYEMFDRLSRSSELGRVISER
ncbi:MAG: serine hydrolase [Acidobacteria bacterium]|nr:MAG: serine hydrolase [Acidobacteriota bacterium]